MTQRTILPCRIFGHKWRTFDTYEDGFQCQMCMRWWGYMCRATRGIYPVERKPPLARGIQVSDKLAETSETEALARENSELLGLNARLQDALQQIHDLADGLLNDIEEMAA